MSAPEHTPERPDAPTILIVDDDPVVRTLMQDVLEDDGFRVLEAADGAQALRCCEAAIPSLMVVDAVMPNMDGFELSRRLRESPATRHVPILMATGLDDLASITRAYEAGATDFISKPLNWLILSYRIRYMLRGARTLEDLRLNQERLRTAQELEREQSERFEAALANMSQGLCMVGSDQRLIVANQRFRDLYHLSASAAAPGRTMEDVFKSSPIFGLQPRGAMEVALQAYLDFARQRTSAVLTQELSDGRIVTITHEPTAAGGFVDTFTDVTQERQAEAQIVHLALHDTLTDLPNRVLFRERLTEALRRVSRGELCAVFCLDLDQFKNVNDTLGHPAGDELLKLVTERLSHVVRQVDTVARVGGDEFAIVQSSTEQPLAATALANRLLSALSQPFEIEEHQVQIGTSIGITIAPWDGVDPDVLIKNADIALYQAKSDGRNCYRYFEREMDAMMQVRRQLELDLRKALAGEELRVFFQPLVNIERQRIIGFEALVRWESPERGLVSPADFIPIAEENGMIVQIGEWVLRRACRLAASWPEPLKVAVNVSTVQFNGRALVPAVRSALQESGLDPSRLELEVTESVMVADFKSALSILHELKNLGTSISMDDFGTGYSSLSYLRSFPFDKIKIDQSFVQEIGKADSMAIIRAVIGMCNSLGIKVIAEGVETPQQLRVLSAENCTEIQGYLISKPRPSDEIPPLILDFNRAALTDGDPGTPIDELIATPGAS